MKVLITNSVVLNGGEAATVAAVVAVVRQAFGPQTECVVYDQQAAIAQRYYPDLAFRRLLYHHVSHAPNVRLFGGVIGRANRTRFMTACHLWARGWRRTARLLLTAQERVDLRHYTSADLVISTGGTYLVDNYNLASRVFDYEVTLALGKPLVFFTQSIGPLDKPWNRKRLRPVLDRARLILLRDEPSLKHVRGLNVSNPNVHLSADAVFALAPINGELHANGVSRNGDDRGRPQAAISVRHWLHFKSIDLATGMRRYREAIVAATCHLVRQRGFDVTFLSSCQGVQEYWADDSAEALEIEKLLPADVRKHVRVDREFRTPTEMVESLHGFQLVIATRFHMAVFALLAGTPVVAIGYEFKTHAMYRELGAEELVLDIETVRGPELCGAVDRLMAGEQQLMAGLRSAVARERDRALSAGDLLKRIVSERAAS